MSKLAVHHCHPIKFGIKIRPFPKSMAYHVDAEPSRCRLIYRKILKEIDEELVSQDLKSLKFLCQDFLPLSKLERITRGLELVTELEAKGLIKEGNFRFLAEILLRIGRHDLLKKIKYSSQDFKCELQKLGCQIVSPYRALLMEVCEDLTKSEVEQMKFIASAWVTRKQLEKVVDGIDLCVVLEKGEVLGKTCVEPLVELIQGLDRLDLINKLERYQSKQHESNMDSSEYSLGGIQDNTLSTGPFVPYIHPQPVHPNPHNFQQRQVNLCHRQLMTTAREPHNRNAPQRFLTNDARVMGDSDLVGQPLPGNQGNVLPVSANQRSVVERVERQQMQMLPSKVPVTVAMATEESFGGSLRGPVPMESLPSRSQPAHYSLRQRPYSGNIHQHHNTVVPRSTYHQSAVDVVPPTNQAALLQNNPQEDSDYYPVTAVPRGYCIIINNEKFYKVPNDPESKKMPDREGTNVDRDNLVLIFEKLGFKTEVYENLTHSEMDRTLKHYSINIDHSAFDMFVCCVLTHGIQGQLYGTDGRVVGIQSLTQSLKAVTCPSLLGKPKLFFIQACQGRDKQPAVEVDAPCDSNPNTLPNEADFLLGYATVPGFVSFRSKTHGSWYITTLCRMLEQYANSNLDILQILTKVNNEVSKGNAFVKENIYKQVPAPQYTLRKQLYLRTVY